MNIYGNNQVWIDVITGERSLTFEGLSTRMLLSRLRLRARRDPSVKNLNICAEDLKNFFVKNLNTPAIKRDMKAIFS